MTQEIEFSELSGRNGNLGLITLNRPQALNALNHAMFIDINRQLIEWKEANHIKAIIIRAVEGRAFCAGGDIRSAYQLKKENNLALIDFFRDEYTMNQRIYHFPKPYIALLDGITMGGGAGISINGSHRVATENLLFAMPETGIGFYPDVGGTFFLSHLPYKIGIYLGLTGVKISVHDCLALGLVNHLVKKEHFPDIIFALADASLQENARDNVTQVLQKFSLGNGQSELLQHREEIITCFSKETIEEILTALENYPSEWCENTAKLIKTKSPTSLKVTLQALQQGKNLQFDECMQMEYRLTNRFIQNRDFFEGIRALLIDKDQRPHWHPSRLEDISAMVINEYFSPLAEELV